MLEAEELLQKIFLEINIASLKCGRPSLAKALDNGGGAVRVQPLVDRTAHMLQVKCGLRNLVPGAPDVCVSPLTSQAVKSIPLQGSTDCESPWATSTGSSFRPSRTA